MTNGDLDALAAEAQVVYDMPDFKETKRKLKSQYMGLVKKHQGDHTKAEEEFKKKIVTWK